MKKIIATLILSTLCGLTFAQSNKTLPSTDSLPQVKSTTQGQPPTGRNPEIDAALQTCMSSATKDSNGHPDRTSVDTCMKAKGFTPPEGHGPGDHKGPPPDKTTK